MKLSKEQEIVRRVFSGCAELYGEDEVESVGQCVDDSIVSEEEGGFRITELGEEAMEKGKDRRIDIKEGADVIIED